MTSEKDIVEEIDQNIDFEKLEKVAFSDIKKPMVFGKTDTFVFELIETGAYVIPNQKTRVGYEDMYLLVTNPKIYCFRNALKQLEKFVMTEKIVLPATIKYVGREGTDFDTKYMFELAKKK